MTTKPLPSNTQLANQDQGFSRFIVQAKSLMKNISWLSPSISLGSTGSSHFGRNIENALNGLTQDDGIITLMLRRKRKAVVMSIHHYEQLLKMKEACEKLLEIESQRVISDAANDFDALYSRITSPCQWQLKTDPLWSRLAT